MCMVDYKGGFCYVTVIINGLKRYHYNVTVCNGMDDGQALFTIDYFQNNDRNGIYFYKAVYPQHNSNILNFLE